eukprot:3263852-Pleurochrysis_carterae.AAC.1
MRPQAHCPFIITDEQCSSVGIANLAASTPLSLSGLRVRFTLGSASLSLAPVFRARSRRVPLRQALLIACVSRPRSTNTLFPPSQSPKSPPKSSPQIVRCLRPREELDPFCAELRLL